MKNWIMAKYKNGADLSCISMTADAYKRNAKRFPIKVLFGMITSGLKGSEELEKMEMTCNCIS
jgi:hypothetical protein